MLNEGNMVDVVYYNQSSFHAGDIDLENMKVNYVLPFSNHDNGGLMAIAGLYAMLFMLGTCGNAAILAVVHHVRSMDARARHNTTLSYICILSIVDFVSMLPLPMTIIDQVLGFWMFGTFACKLFRLFEHIGKIFSTFILVCFSIDRYCAVCHPLKNRLRNPTTAYVMLCATFALTCILLCPILIFAQSKEIVVHEKYNHVTNELTRLHLYKCVDDLGNELFILFTLTCFLFAYLVPLLLMIYFYYGMLMRLIKQTRTARKSLKGARRRKSFTEEKIPIARIAVYTLAICLFHFVCWTPYWISVLYSLYLEIFQALDLQMPDSSFIYFMYGVHALPYINSASNFILYGLLNRQLHQIPNQMNYRRGTMGRQSINRNVPRLTLAEPNESFTNSTHEHPPTMNGGTQDGPSCRISSASVSKKKFIHCVSPCSRHSSVPLGTPSTSIKNISQRGAPSIPTLGDETYKEVDEVPLFDSDHKSALSFISDDPDANLNEIKL